MTIPGDFNHDGAADADDYIIWRNNPGGIYTPDDCTTWRSNFGRSIFRTKGCWRRRSSARR